MITFLPKSIKKLYHATFNVNKHSILKEGLVIGKKRSWGGQVDVNCIYLATDPDIAYDFCECADEIDDDAYDVYESGIVVLEIDTSLLDIDEHSLFPDPNIIFDEEAHRFNTDKEDYEDSDEYEDVIYAFAYTKNIPPSAITVYSEY